MPCSPAAWLRKLSIAPSRPRPIAPILPFPARLAAGDSNSRVPFRPALLLLLAAYFGSPVKPQAPALGATVELGCLAALAQLSVLEDSGQVETTPTPPEGNWGNMLAVM